MVRSKKLKLLHLCCPFKFTFKFKAGFPITEGTWEERVQTKVQKRVWWKLWLGTSTFYEIEYRKRSSDNAEIPSVENLLDGFGIYFNK